MGEHLMKTIKRRFEQFLFYDYKGIESHLAQMAQKGWQLHKITPFYWEYNRIEPQAITYTVTYFSEASEFNPYPTLNQQTFHEYCKDAGWNLVAEWAQMQIFCTDQVNPTAIETEESVKLKAIHRAMKKNFLPSNIVLLLMSLVQILFHLYQIGSDPVSLLSKGSTIYMMISWIFISLYTLVSLSGYGIWYQKSKKSIRMEGSCIENSNRYKSLNKFLLALPIVSITLTVIAISTQQLGWYGLLGFANVTLVLLLAFRIKKSLKQAKISRSVNLTVTIVSCVLLSLTFTGIMTWIIFQGVNSGRFTRQPVDTYTTTLKDGANHTWDIYQDPLPLRVEDLQSVDYAHYSYKLTVTKSLFLAQYEAQQNSFPDGQQAPELTYTIVDVKVHALFDICLNDFLEMYSYDYDLPEEYRRYFKKINDPRWQVDSVYQLYTQEEAMDEYILEFGSRIVYINFDGIPSDKQIAIAVAKMLNYRK